MTFTNNTLENNNFEFDFSLCHGNTYYDEYEYCRICA